MAKRSSSSKRGFAGMDSDTQRDIASKGGKASAASQDMSELGSMGAAAQSTAAKRRGGKNSHKNG